MNEHELLERYEALGDERDFLAAKPLFEDALAETPDDSLLRRDYGYLLECHARNELRLAVTQYERTIELDPEAEKPRYQLNSAYTALHEPERAIAICKKRLAASPSDHHEYRLLANAYLLARDFEQAQAVITAGLALAPDDQTLIAERGEVKAATGDPEGALADWSLALEFDPEDIGPLYSSAFLLEREGRLDEARDTWRAIIDWNQTRGFILQTDWPKRELHRLADRGGMKSFPLPRNLVDAVESEDDGRGGWIARLPGIVEELEQRWSLKVGEPFQPGGPTAWVAPARTATGGDLVLKVGWRHPEAAHEADGLRAWNGQGAVFLHATEEFHDTIALLLERCIPGSPLASRPDPEQDTVIASLLSRLWQAPTARQQFLPLQDMCEAWAHEFELKAATRPLSIDPGLARSCR